MTALLYAVLLLIGIALVAARVLLRSRLPPAEALQPIRILWIPAVAVFLLFCTLMGFRAAFADSDIVQAMAWLMAPMAASYMLLSALQRR